MTEVQHGAHPLVSFISFNHGCLDLAGGLHAVNHRPLVSAQNRSRIGLQPFKECLVRDDPVLDDLGQSGPKFPWRQGSKATDVAQDEIGLVESPHHIFGLGKVDSHFAPHAAIDLRQQTRGNLNQGEASHKGGSDESSQITNHSSAECDDRRAAIQPQREDSVVERCRRLQAFEFFPIRYFEGCQGDARLFKRREHPLTIQGANHRVGDQDAPPRKAEGSTQAPDLWKDFRPDVDRIAPVSEADRYRLHRLPFKNFMDIDPRQDSGSHFLNT